MYNNKILSIRNLKRFNFNFQETKKNVIAYFEYLERLKLEWKKLSTQKGLTAKYDFAVEYKKRPFSLIGKDTFNLSAKEIIEDELKNQISSYYWAKSVLSDKEQLYINEYFVNGKTNEELIDLLGLNSIDSNEYRLLKKSAIYKFADFLNLIVEK